MRETKIARVGVALAMAALLLAGCSGSSGGGSDAPATTSTTTKAAVTTTTSAATTTAGPTTTTKPGTTTSTTAAEPSNGLEPGDPCSIEEGSPDCIDTDDDGEGTYLIGGADCIATAADPAVCEDTDGNGLAGDQG